MGRHSNKKHFNKNSNKTKRLFSSSSETLASFQKEITIVYFETLLMIKLFHWKTHSYATHKATDELYSKLNSNIDTFIEVLLGKSGVRTQLTDHKTIRLLDFNSQDVFEKEMKEFKNYLVALNDNKAMQQMSNTDLYNIRDEILGDVNQFLYLLSFK
jgi:DNA-binding ferritin-like protein